MNIASNPASTNSKLTKHIPKTIIFDKEALYDSTLKLKQFSNNLAEENYKLKAKMQQIEDELNKKNRLLNGLMAQMSNLTRSPSIQKMQKEVLASR